MVLGFAVGSADCLLRGAVFTCGEQVVVFCKLI